MISKPVFAEERKEAILQYIDRVKKATVSELCSKFKVSASTIRTDLCQLENAGYLRRTHGGALSNKHDKVGLEPTPSFKQNEMLPQKRCIAIEAAKLVEDGDTIAIATGTTTMELAKHLTQKNKLTVVLNDIRLAAWMEEQTQHALFVIGGTVRRNFHYVNFTEDAMPKINIDKLFFSCNGVDAARGATIPDFLLASNVRQLIRYSAESYLLCDSSKVGRIAFARIAKIEDITKIIVDNGISPEQLQHFRDSGHHNIIVANP